MEENARKKFLKQSALLAASTFVPSSLLRSQRKVKEFIPPIEETLVQHTQEENVFKQAPLPFEFDALQPYIDAQTIELHYTKHHPAYIRNLNKAIENTPERFLNLDNIVAKALTLGRTIRDNAGGHWNHSFFWQCITPVSQPKTPSDAVRTLINDSFGSLENMKDTFKKQALSVFGSGWVWLLIKDNQLSIATTSNQDNPLMEGVLPEKKYAVLGLDLWEHAYYLKYQNRRDEYVHNFWNIVNWDYVHSLIDSLRNA